MRELDNAIRDAENEYDWDISYRQTDQQQASRSKIYTFEVIVEGQYAQYDAEEFFSDYNFYSVYVETTSHSYAVLTIEIDSY